MNSSRQARVSEAMDKGSAALKASMISSREPKEGNTPVALIPSVTSSKSSRKCSAEVARVRLGAPLADSAHRPRDRTLL
jgi:hypothetical protein